MAEFWKYSLIKAHVSSFFFPFSYQAPTGTPSYQGKGRLSKLVDAIVPEFILFYNGWGEASKEFSCVKDS